MGGRVKKKKKVQILKKMDTCRNSKHSLRQNLAYIYIRLALFYGENRFILKFKFEIYGRKRNGF
jgi:hypothetical protein